MSARSWNFSFDEATIRSRHVALNSAITPEITMAAAAVTARALEFRRGSGRHPGRASTGRFTSRESTVVVLHSWLIVKVRGLRTGGTKGPRRSRRRTYG